MSDAKNRIFHAARRGMLLVGGTLSFMPLGPTLAQTQEGATGSVGLEEVVVTAERREESLQRTSLSIVALDQIVLEEKGINDIGDLTRATPSLSSVSDIEGTRPVFLIRGVGNTSGRETQEAGVALYVDDIYLPRANGAFLQLVDVERVEVLRGPQGTLFGRNSSGGAIRYLSKKPARDFEASASATIGTDDRQDLSALVNLPLGSHAAARFQFGSFQQDGYIDLTQADFKGGNVDDIVARGVLRLFATDDLTIDIGTMYAKSQRDRPASVVLSNNITGPQTVALSAALVALGQPALQVNDPRFVFADKYKSSGACYVGSNTLGATNANNRTIFNDVANYCTGKHVQTSQVSFLDVGWNLTDSVSMRALSGYVDGTTEGYGDGGLMGVVRQFDDSSYDSFSQELQLKFSSERLETVGGLYYFTESTERFIYNAQLSGAPGQVGRCCTGYKSTPQTESDSKGAFVQASLDITEALKLTLGARYSEDTKDILISRTDRPTAAPGTVYTNSDDWSSTDYRGTLQYQFTDDLMAYATVSTGYKAGGFNDGIAAQQIQNGGTYAYDPEEVLSYEVGFKSQWFEDRLRFNLTAYRMDYTDLQLSTPIVDTTTVPSTTVIIVQNAGEIRLSGIEAELMWLATRNLSFDASVSTIDQKAISLKNGVGLLDTTTCVNPAAPTFTTCDAQDLGAAPKYQFTVGTNYGIAVGTGDVTLNASYAYTDEKFSSNSAASSVLIPAYGLLNLRAQYSAESDKWSAALYGKNVTDKYYLVTGQDGLPAFGSVVAIVGRGAEYGVEFKTRF